MAHAVEEPEAPMAMTSPGTQFFCCVNVRAEHDAWRRVGDCSVPKFSRRGPSQSWTSWKRNGREPSEAAVYSPGRHRKKNPM